MVKYVNKDIISAKMMHCNFRSPNMTVSDFINDELPTADVQPVKRGRWDYSEEDNGECEWYFCSECDSPAEQLYTDEPLLSEFCPHCGADMRGED